MAQALLSHLSSQNPIFLTGLPDISYDFAGEGNICEAHLKKGNYAMAILFVLPLVLLSGTARAGERLPPLNADMNQTSVSGISSGGTMAVQFHVAYSSLVPRVFASPCLRFAQATWRAIKRIGD